MLTLADMLRGGARSEVNDRPMSRAQRLRELLDSISQESSPNQEQSFPPGKDGITPLFRPDLDARPGSVGTPSNGPYGQPGTGLNGAPMNPLGPGGLEGLPPGILAILNARMGMGSRDDNERFPPGKDGITPLMKPDKFPPGKDGVTPLMIDDRSLMGRGFGKPGY